MVETQSFVELPLSEKTKTGFPTFFFERLANCIFIFTIFKVGDTALFVSNLLIVTISKLLVS